MQQRKIGEKWAQKNRQKSSFFSEIIFSIDLLISKPISRPFFQYSKGFWCTVKDSGEEFFCILVNQWKIFDLQKLFFELQKIIFELQKIFFSCHKKFIFDQFLIF